LTTGELAVTSAGVDVQQRARVAGVVAVWRCRPATRVDRTPRRRLLRSDADRRPGRPASAAVVPRRLRARRPAAAARRSGARPQRQRQTDLRQVRDDVTMTQPALGC